MTSQHVTDCPCLPSW